MPVFAAGFKKLTSCEQWGCFSYLSCFELLLWLSICTCCFIWYLALHVSSCSQVTLIQPNTHKDVLSGQVFAFRTRPDSITNHKSRLLPVNYSCCTHQINSPCSTQWPALQCCWCAACIGAVSVGTWVQRAGPRFAELTPGLTVTAPSCSTWASPSGLRAQTLRFFSPARRWPPGARPHNSGPLHWTEGARILSDKHLHHHDDPSPALFATPSRPALKLDRLVSFLRKELGNPRT